MYPLRVEINLIGQLEQGLNNIAANFSSTRIPGYLKTISPAGNLYIEAAFDLAQMFVELPAKIREPTVVGGFQDNVPGYFCGVQGLAFRPLYMKYAPHTATSLGQGYNDKFRVGILNGPASVLFMPQPADCADVREANSALPR